MAVVHFQDFQIEFRAERGGGAAHQSGQEIDAETAAQADPVGGSVFDHSGGRNDRLHKRQFVGFQIAADLGAGADQFQAVGAHHLSMPSGGASKTRISPPEIRPRQVAL